MKIEQVFPESVVKRNKPINLHQEDSVYFKHELQKTLPSVFMHQYSNSRLDYFGRVFNRRQIHVASKRVSGERFVFYKSLFKKVSKVKSPVILIYDDWYYGYFHWVTESLTKLIALETITQRYVLVLPKEMAKYHIESLACFKFLNIIFIKPDQVLICKEILTIDSVAPMGNYNIKNINLLRTRFLDFFCPRTSTKFSSQNIYVSRAKAKARKLVNESEVSDLLNDHSFQTIYFEDYSFLEQLQIMQSCLNIIVLHGAGLTNIIFSRKKLNVIEIRGSDNSHDNCYFSLASALGHNYYYLKADQVKKNEYFLRPKEVLNLLAKLS